MKRIVVSKAEREKIKGYLANAYHNFHQNSGETKVTSLAFSAEPQHWHISAKCREGAAYANPDAWAANFSDGIRLRRSNVILRAVLSPAWLELIPSYPLSLRDADHRYEIIAGVQQLDAPSGVDTLELICASKSNRYKSYSLQSSFRLRFNTGPLVKSYDITDHIPGIRFRGLDAVVAHHHQIFRRDIAAHVAARLQGKKRNLEP